MIIVTLLCSFIEIRLQHRCSPENFINIFRKSSQINTCGLLLLLFSLITEILVTLTWRCFIKVSSTKKWNLEEKKKKMCYGDDSGLQNVQSESTNWGLTEISNIFYKVTFVQSFMLVPLNEVYWCILTHTNLTMNKIKY